MLRRFLAALQSTSTPCYSAIFNPSQHLKGKAHTYTIESMNNRLRCYLARLRRKTHCYLKSVDNLRDSLLFVFQCRLQCP
jgi:IS1 family transposase